MAARASSISRPDFSADALLRKRGADRRFIGGRVSHSGFTFSSTARRSNVSVSLTAGPGGYRATLRFKTGGMTVQRPVGKFEAESEGQALKAAWQTLRAPGFVEKEGWTWEVPNL